MKKSLTSKEENTTRMKQRVKTRGKRKKNEKGEETGKETDHSDLGFVTPPEYLEKLSPWGLENKQNVEQNNYVIKIMAGKVYFNFFRCLPTV